MKTYSKQEESLNVYSHLAGLVLSLIGTSYLLYQAISCQDVWKIVSSSLFCLGMVAQYTASTLYHSATEPKVRKYFRVFDHGAIYLYIAGCYSPFTLVVLRDYGWWGWSVFAIIWLAAIVGIALNFLPMKKTNHIKTISYILMGWVIIVAIKPLYDVLSASGQVESLYWLAAEAIFYTVGAVLYSISKVQYMHAVWHFFVLGGSISHYMATLIVI